MEAKTPTQQIITTTQIKTLEYQFKEFTGVDQWINICTKGRVNKITDLTRDEADFLIRATLILEKGSNKMEQEKKYQKPITPAQIKKIHVLLQQKGLMEEKETMVRSISDGRTGSTKELTSNEARQLISFFLKDDDLEVNKKKQETFNDIWRLAWNVGIIYGNTDEDYQMNKAKLNLFCRQRGTVKKNIGEMNLPELIKTKRQFEAIYKKFKLKNNKT